MDAAASTSSPPPTSSGLLDDAEPTSTAIDAVFERLLSDILKGHYSPGARLPAERELSRQLGASRPTLREALRRLGEWSLVEPRRGSGIVVRPYRDWTIEVLPGYLRYGKPEGKQPSMTQILLDMLGMRRAIVGEVVRAIAPRVPKGGTAPARLAMARAWSMRDSSSYPREDFEVLRTVTEAAGFSPGLWLLNRLADIYLDVASTLRFAIQAPPDYVPIHTKFFDLVEAGEAETASTLMSEYLERHDAVITSMLKGAVKDFPTYKLNALSRKVLHSLVPVICPSEAVPYSDGIIDGVEAVIDSSPRLLHHGFGAGLLAYDLQALAAYGQRAHKLVGEDAERYFTSWEHGLTPMHVQLARAINQIMSMACYEQPEMKKRVGYHVGPWIEEVTQKRLRVYSKDAETHAASLLAPDPLRPGVNVRTLRHKKEAL